MNDFFQGRKVLITAGPTYEKIDPVRFIGNYSSGKMGYALANALADAGAEVHLVSGPVQLDPPQSSVRLYKVESAREMYKTCIELFPDCSVAILSAAVADYRPEHQEEKKIKKKEEEMYIRLIRNPDILATLGEMKSEGQILVGFALETDNELTNAQEKLKRKNADAIVLNSLRDEGAGFQTDTNLIRIILKKGTIFEYTLKDKRLVANDIITCIAENFS